MMLDRPVGPELIGPAPVTGHEYYEAASLPKTDWSREASKGLYPTRTVEDSILNILKNGDGPPIVLGSNRTASDMDLLNTPVCLGSTVTFKSLGFGKST